MPDVIHPVVRTHPENGTKALFITNTRTEFIIDMETSKSEAILQSLYSHIYADRFQYHHHWRKGDLVMWDNRSVNHRACGGYEMNDVRRIHRTSTLGDIPF